MHTMVLIFLEMLSLSGTPYSIIWKSQNDKLWNEVDRTASVNVSFAFYLL